MTTTQISTPATRTYEARTAAGVAFVAEQTTEALEAFLASGESKSARFADVVRAELAAR